MANNRVSLEGFEDLADAYLTQPDVTALNGPGTGAVIVRGDGRSVAVADALALTRFTTIGMQAIEANLGVLYEAGRNRGVGQVARSSVETHIAASAQRGVTLGGDQATMVRAITTSGRGVLCVVGPAGSGKTTALAVAARAWEEAGYRVLGTSVNGNAAETLAREAGIDARTLESRLTWLDLADRPVLTGRDVIIVDEASTIGTRDLERLLRHAQAAGAAVRLVGDPAQHTAVEAGGGFRALIDAYRARDDVVELTVNRRQRGPDMEAVRQALVTYRIGHVKTAWETLAADGRVTVSGDPGRLLDRLVCDWFDDRAAHHADPGRVRRSSMMAESRGHDQNPVHVHTHGCCANSHVRPPQPSVPRMRLSTCSSPKPTMRSPARRNVTSRCVDARFARPLPAHVDGWFGRADPTGQGRRTAGDRRGGAAPLHSPTRAPRRTTPCSRSIRRCAPMTTSPP